MERYDLHTQEVHELEVDNFLQNVAGAAPVGVQNNTKDDIIQILKANGKNELFGKNCPTKIPEKPSRKYIERFIADYLAYFFKCGICDENGNIEESKFLAVWQELKDFGMTQEQLQKVVRSRKRAKNTPNDRFQPFAFKLSDLQAWMINAVVDRNDNWKKLEMIKNKKSTRNKTITDQFEECLEETEDLFNDLVIGKVSKINEDSENAEDGHFKDMNGFMALIEFGKRLNCKSKSLEARIRKVMDPYIFKDFGTFDRNEFVSKLREWEPHDEITIVNSPTNAVTNARGNKEFQEN
jgi:hypothetical protein